MSAKIDDGGPAFPVYVPEGPPLPDGSPEHPAYAKPGMSLRDLLAVQALTGMLANPHASGDIDAIARGAYLQADAMLAARKRED